MDTSYEHDDNLPDSEHVGRVMDGVLDSLSGTESMTLTSNQIYLQGVLYAESNSICSVSGNESFFGSIASGVKKGIDYIVKMFKSIFDFIFGGRRRAQEKEVDDLLAKIGQDLEKLEKSSIQVTRVDIVAKDVSHKVERMEESPEKTALQHKLEEIKAETVPTKKAEQVRIIMPEVFNAGVKTSKKLKKVGDDLDAAIKALEKHRDDQKAAAQDSANGAKKAERADTLATDVQTLLNGLINLPKDVAHISSVSTAREFISKSRRCIQAMENNLENIKSYHSSLQSKLDHLTKAAAKSPSDQAHAELNAQVRQDMSELRGAMLDCTAIIGTTRKVWDAMHRAAGELEKAIIIVI